MDEYGFSKNILELLSGYGVVSCVIKVGVASQVF
jgi:hypothetical protein